MKEHVICRDLLERKPARQLKMFYKPLAPGITDEHVEISREVKFMAKIVFKFFEVNVENDQVSLFLKKLEEVLKKFAGEAYHFKYSLEEPLNTIGPKTQKNGLKGHNSGFHTNRV